MEFTLGELLDVDFYFHQIKRARFFESHRPGSVQVIFVGVFFGYSKILHSGVRRMVLLPSPAALHFARTRGERNCVAKWHPVRLLLERL